MQIKSGLDRSGGEIGPEVLTDDQIVVRVLVQIDELEAGLHLPTQQVSQGVAVSGFYKGAVFTKY